MLLCAWILDCFELWNPWQQATTRYQQVAVGLAVACKLHAGCMQVACRLHAGCMQVACRLHTVAPEIQIPSCSHLLSSSAACLSRGLSEAKDVYGRVEDHTASSGSSSSHLNLCGRGKTALTVPHSISLNSIARRRCVRTSRLQTESLVHFSCLSGVLVQDLRGEGDLPCAVEVGGLWGAVAAGGCGGGVWVGGRGTLAKRTERELLVPHPFRGLFECVLHHVWFHYFALYSCFG